ncbi:MAG: rhomboid family intramembrane serine protease [Bacilli bacterium]|nr:rhomboid family intramembrane serine protease [Bacilli bacterium]
MTEKRDLLVMKFLHYFITGKNYNPVIVHGIQNEIWLENMDSEFRIVRIVMGYIHNQEQLNFDNYKVNRLVRQIKLKTFTLKMKVMTLYLDVNEDVELASTKINYPVRIKNEASLKNSEVISSYFPDMVDKLRFTEEGALLYEKINADILKKNLNDSEKINDLFSKKKPVVTNLLILVITLVMIATYVFGKGSMDIATLYLFGGLVKDGSPIRLLTSIFLHIGLLHFLMNVWALKLLGDQTENFYGHLKTFIIFIYSGIVGNLLSVILMGSNTISAGASGAIFGFMGAILYFAINQRTYMGEALRREILPVIIINILFGFVLTGVNMYAHVGGLIGGMLIATALGIKHKSSRFEKINGFVASTILVIVLSYLAYFM